MKHLSKITVAKAEEADGCDIIAWLENLWANIVNWVKGFFNRPE